MLSFIINTIGCLVLLKFAYHVGLFVYICFVRPGKDLKKEYGEWAVVTGATDGIGKAFAAELSKQHKMKVLLVSRSEANLAETKKELEAAGAAGIETLAIDFSDFDEGKRTKVKEALKGKDVGVLINNVGISYDHPEYFHLLDEDRVGKLMSVNIDSTTWMSRIVLPGMVEKKKGAVVNIASSSAVCSAPLLAEYSAAKNYVIKFSQSLYGELASQGVHVQVQYPHFVTSKLSKIRHASMSTPHPAGYAKAAVKAIGFERDISPYWSHYIICSALAALPYMVQEMLCNSMHHTIRKKALKKKASADAAK